MKGLPLTFTAMLCIWCLSTGLAQSSEEALKPITRTYALKNVTIVTKPGQTIQNGTVIVKDGLIHSAGQNVSIPADAKIIPADSMFVYAGFIDALSNAGIPRPEVRPATGGGPGGGGGQGQRPTGINPGAPPNDLAGIQPEQNARELIKPSEKSIEDLRKLGFTNAHVAPIGRMLPGSSALISLGGSVADNMVVKDNFAMISQLVGAQGVYPQTVIAVMSKFRELYKQAEQAKAHEKMYAANPAGMARPAGDRSLQAFYPVLDKQRSVCFVAPDLKSIYRVLALQQELKFPLILGGLRQAWPLVDQLKAQNIPVILSLDLPKMEKKEPAKKDSTAAKDPELERLEKRRADEMKLYETQAATFAGKGINFGFSSLNAKTADIREAMRRMVKAGLKEDQALAALTTAPAAMFGVSQTMGTVEKGKIANLVVSKKSYFDEKSEVRYVFVDGTLYEYEASAPAARPGAAAAGRGAAPADLSKFLGKWSYTIDAGDQVFKGTITLTDDGGKIGGSWTGADGQSQSLSSPVLKGNDLTFNSTVNMGQELALDFNLTFDGTKFSGKVKAGDFGVFPIEGSKEPRD
ncbi:MAG: amidohydrolase family protein [Haliscomenobacter sp.]|nr:amidohydrolase family protein [Haliscomenobacter sp.]MBK9492333.1 amidohydrolase family protein [Haliscomenobacter sp.]